MVAEIEGERTWSLELAWRRPLHTPDRAELLLDPTLFARGAAHALFARLREETPVLFCPRSRGTAFWGVFRYDDVVRVLRDPVTFLSGRGTGLLIDPADAPRYRSLNRSDPPLHVAMRRLVQPFFDRQAITRMAGEVAARAEALVTGALARGTQDVIETLATPLPLGTLCRLLGFEDADAPFLLSISHRVSRMQDPAFRLPGETPEVAFQHAERELMARLERLFDERQAAPRDDVASALIHARVDGEPLGRRDALFLLRLLVETGHATTTQAIAGGLLALAEHAGEQDRLHADLALIPSAIEEILRWTSPIIRFGRVAARDVELGGHRVRAGERIVVFYPSANRDERVFEDAGRLDLSRDPNPHVALGAGPHGCLGASLVRLHLRIVLEFLVKHAAWLSTAGSPEPFLSSLDAGYGRVPLTLQAR